MLKPLIAGALALGAATSANAVTVIEIPFGTNLGDVTRTFSFNNAADDGLVSGTDGVDFRFLTPPGDTGPDGAEIAGGDGTRFLSVLGGGTAGISFGFSVPATSFALDIGSVDSFNSLTVTYAGGGSVVVTGTQIANPANGDQTSPRTNGRFAFIGDGRTITGITLASGTNSFEVDNLTTAVPEPATWGMMILGFGVIGASMRRRRATNFVTA